MTSGKVKIKDFAKVITGGTPSTKEKSYWENGSIPWLNSGELNQDIVTTTRNYITEAGLKGSAARLMPPDTVLIALTGATTGVVGYLTFEASANQSVTGILPSESHLPKYLYYYLKSIRQQVIDLSYGGAQNHISQGFVQNIEVPLPNLPEQKRIATILDHADTIRRKNRQILEKYNELVQSIYQDMFGDTFVNDKKWKIAFLADLVKKDKIITYGIVQAGPNFENGIPYIRTGDIANGKIKEANLLKTSPEIAKSYTRSKCETGDIIMSIRATVGTSAILPESLNGANLTQGTARISPDTNKINPVYLYYTIKSKGIQTKINLEAKGATFREITLKRLREISIPIPPLNIQDKFEKAINLINQQKDLTQKSLQKSEDLFQSLLQRAFKGEL